MANSAFNHSPSIVVPGSSTNTALVRWSGTGADTFTDSTIIVGATTMGLAADTDLLTFGNGTIAITGTVTGATSITSTQFVGGGVGITGLAAGNITASGTLPALNGAALTALTAANITASGTLPALNGAALTALNGTQVTSGTLPAARIAADSIVEGKLNVSNGPTNGHVLTARSGVAGGFTWEAASAGAALTGSTNNTIVTVTGSDAMKGNADLTWDGDNLVIDGGANNNGWITFTIAAGASGNPNIGWKEGSGNGSTNNMLYEMGYDATNNKWAMYSRATAGVSGSAGTGANIIEIADGSPEIKVKENNSMPSVTKGIAKAWMKNSGAATPAVEDSYNCTLTDNGTGDRLYTFGDDFENDDYVCVGNAYGPAGNDLQGLIFGQNTLAVGSVDCLVRTSASASNLDLPNAVAFFGEAT